MKGAMLRWIGLLVASVFLTALPLPLILRISMLPWICIFLFYTLMFGEMSVVWIAIVVAGGVLDVMQVTVLGEHALALTLSLWLAKSKALRFHYYSANQQVAWVSLVCVSYGLILLATDLALGAPFNAFYLIGVVMSGLMGGICWPWIQLTLDTCLVKTTPLRRSPLKYL